MAAKKDIKYVDAMVKIDEILKKVESDSENVDVDKLIDNVEEAASLILLCKKKLFNTEAKIEKVFEKLEQDSE